jgi:hypothetical protein
LKKRKEKNEKDDGQSFSSESSESEVDETNSATNNDIDIQLNKAVEEPVTVEPAEPAVPRKKITETDLNSMGAKILRAELMGNEVCITE